MRLPSLAALALVALLPLAVTADDGPAPPPRAAGADVAGAPPAEELAGAPDEDAAPRGEAIPPGTTNGVLRNLQVPPPGAPEDVALWRRANDNDLALMAARGDSTRLQALASTSGYGPRLDAAVARGAVDASRAGALRERLEDAWLEVARILTARWRIDPTRVCRYPLLAFDNLMEMADGPTKGPRLAQARGRLGDCTAAAEGILRQLSSANAAMRDALAEIDRVAGPAAPPEPKAPAGAEARR